RRAVKTAPRTSFPRRPSGWRLPRSSLTLPLVKLVKLVARAAHVPLVVFACCPRGGACCRPLPVRAVSRRPARSRRAPTHAGTAGRVRHRRAGGDRAQSRAAVRLWSLCPPGVLRGRCCPLGVAKV